MKSGLHQPQSCVSPLRSIHHRLHQLPSNTNVLCARVDGNRADTAGRGTLVEAIASYDAAPDFRHHTVEARTGKHHRKYAGRRFRAWEIARKSMSCIDVQEGIVANLAADRTV